MQGARIAPLPAPVGGWDTRAAIAEMPATHALVLDNWFPGTDKVTLRPGYTPWVTALGASVESLMLYAGVDGSQKLFAAAGGSIFSANTQIVSPSAAVTGKSNARWQHINIGTAGGQFLMAVNGADTPITYNGSTWSTASITGPTVANLVWINLHNQRVWFGEKNSLDAWYLPVNSISGTALRFPLAGIARKGGYIMAAGTWSRDSFSGTTDYLVFLTSEGEAIIYGGTDPSSTTTWALQGVFRIGRPIGRRCMINAAADLIMITQDGFVQASTILPVDRAQADSAAISAQINPAVVTSANNYGSLFGWQPFIWPHGNMLIFNVPRNDGPSYQYVFNTLTQAPCRFTDINAVCWSLLSDTPYFGSPDGCVYQFGIVYDDAGGQIEGDALQAFNYFGRPAQKKVFPTIELVLECSETPNIGAGLAVDFDQSTGITAPSQIVPATEYFWDEARWDEGGWSNSQAVFSNWYGAGGIGRAAAPRLRCSMAGIQLSWLATNVMMTDGGPL